MAGRSSGVAVDEAREPLRSEGRQQPADLAHPQLEDPRRLLGRDPAGVEMLQDVEAPLRPSIHPDRLPRLHAIEVGKIAVIGISRESLLTLLRRSHIFVASCEKLLFP